MLRFWTSQNDKYMDNKLKLIFVRENITKSVRKFFEREKFHEVETPVLNSSLPLEPNIHPFATEWKRVKGEKKIYLSTSPEAGLKKMIAAGIGNCFSIGHSFRNLEDAGTLHNPEFLMLEWYREDADYKDIMENCERLVSYLFLKNKEQITENKKTSVKKDVNNRNILTYQNRTISFRRPWQRITMTDLFGKYAGLDLDEIIDDEVLRRKAKEKGYDIKSADWEQLFNQIFLNEIEPKLSPTPHFITDFPSRISPLCKPRKDKPYLAERFEFYLFGTELGNGNSENTDSQLIRSRMKEEMVYRSEKKIDFAPIDELFLAALEKMKSKSWAGIGLGLDRLAMILADTKNIKSLEI
ncbi:MAG: hypothetical protein M1366_02675 [Patescibacteria group bacterium]|nr:hypothetical protein [Patescibacteria group bacterium]